MQSTIIARELINDGRILDLAKIDDEDDEDEDDDTDRDSGNNLPDDGKELNLKESGNITMTFQERSLREYFQAVDVDEHGLRTPPSTAHLIIFEMTASRLLSGYDRTNHAGDRNLLDYASRFWIRHFVDIDLSKATDEAVSRVVATLFKILQNSNNVARTLEYSSSQIYSEMLPGNDISWLNNVEAWIQRGVLIDANPSSSDIMSWSKTFTRETALLPLARGHIQNWFKECLGPANTACIRFARDALKLVRMSPHRDTCRT